MRTTVNIQDPLLAGAKRLATERGVTLSDVVEDALRALLSSPAPKKRSRFRLHVVKGELFNPLINLDKTSELLLREDEEAFGRMDR